MTEIEALVKIAQAIEHLAASVGTLATVAILTLIFKKQSSNSSIERLCDILEDWFRSKRK